jgi:hypothetical protein
MQNIERMEYNNTRRRYRCTFCRREGHNRMTCNDQRLRELEVECSIQCQTMDQIEFYDWMYQTYGNESTLLKTYAAKKCHIVVSHTDIFMCIDAITQYIYHTYKYQYENENDSETDYSDMPELVDLNDPIESNFEQDMVRILEDMRNPVEREIITQNPPFTNDMVSALQNDFMRSAMLFLEMTRNMDIRINEPKKFTIESVIEPHTELEQSSECCICFENYKKEKFVTLNCKHEFCNGCLKKALCSDNRPKPCCAYCRTEVTKMISRTTDVYNELAELIL